MSLNCAYYQVRDFHRAGRHPVNESLIPIPLSEARSYLRANWMKEEVAEFIEAKNDVAGQVDAMIDLIYFALGTLVEIGLPPDKVFDIVHQANMGKFDKGEVVYKADGKIGKPKGWMPPEVLIEQYIAELSTSSDVESDSCDIDEYNV